MTYEDIRVETRGVTATITLTRPKALNAITPKMLAELERAVRAAGDDEAVRVVVVTGEGRAFSAGVDLKALGEVKLSGGGVGDILDGPARSAIAAIREVPKPVIARVNGFCFTGALEIALACDLLVVAEEAKLGDTHAKWGLRPTWGMSARLPAAVGMRRAKELSFTARTFTGVEAHAMGLANRVAPLADLDASVGELVEAIVANSAGSIAAYKALYNQGPLDPPTADEEARRFEIGDTDARLGDFR